MTNSSFDSLDIFTQRELLALKAFYARVPARKIRPQYGDPWPILARHRALPKDQYQAVRDALNDLVAPADGSDDYV